MLQERSNIAPSFEERLEFPTYIYFTHGVWKSCDKLRSANYNWISRINYFYTWTLGKLRQTKIKKQDSWFFPLWKCYIQAAQRYKYYCCFFWGLPRIWKIKDSSYRIWKSSDILNLTNQNQVTVHFENAMYRVHHERSNIAASLVEHLEFPE